MSLSGQNSGAAGTVTLVTKTIPVHLEPDTLGEILHNVYITYYNSINYRTAVYLNQAF
jgi:hypothetical protein